MIAKNTIKMQEMSRRKVKIAIFVEN